MEQREYICVDTADLFALFTPISFSTAYFTLWTDPPPPSLSLPQVCRGTSSASRTFGVAGFRYYRIDPCPPRPTLDPPTPHGGALGCSIGGALAAASVAHVLVVVPVRIGTFLPRRQALSELSAVSRGNKVAPTCPLLLGLSFVAPPPHPVFVMLLPFVAPRSSPTRPRKYARKRSTSMAPF